MTPVQTSNNNFSELKVKLADQFAKEDCLTIEQVARELGLGKQRAKQIMNEGIKKRLVQNLVKRDGVRLLYPELMIKQLKSAYKSNTRSYTMKPSTETSLKNAKLVLQVPVFDEIVKNLLLKRFGNEQNIAEFLRDKLSESYKPVLSELQKLDMEFEEKKKRIIEGNM